VLTPNRRMDRSRTVPGFEEEDFDKLHELVTEVIWIKEPRG